MSTPTGSATLVPVAARLIDAELDRREAVLGPPPAPELQEALNQLTIDLYQSKTPAPGAGSSSPPSSATRSDT